MSDFNPATAKVSITSIDTGLSVSAQYNPKELQVDRTIPWQPHEQGNADGLQLEFTGAQGREMSLELLFDGYENAGTTSSGKTVADLIKDLTTLASVRDATSTTDDLRRPHHCVVTWG